MAEAQMNVGFIGLGIMGTAMARNLIKSKQFKSVMIWNRTLSKTAELAGEGALVGKTIAEVITHSDITFAVLGDPDAAIEAVFGETGVLSAITAGKGYVDMSTVDEQTSTKIATAVTAKGGLFLEAVSAWGLVGLVAAVRCFDAGVAVVAAAVSASSQLAWECLRESSLTLWAQPAVMAGPTSSPARCDRLRRALYLGLSRV
ncbi:MAG: hypothetical protein WDW38_008389 [Sanguina aurantia]